MESVYEKPSPNNAVSISAAAADVVLWPDVYSGKGGVWMKEIHCSSISRWMAVCGRMRTVRYFASQQAMKASYKATDVQTYAFAEATAPSPRCRQAVCVMAIQ